MIVKKEMKKILLLISMTMNITTWKTLFYKATHAKYAETKPP